MVYNGQSSVEYRRQQQSGRMNTSLSDLFCTKLLSMQ